MTKTKRKPGPIKGRPAGKHLEKKLAKARSKYNAKGSWVESHLNHLDTVWMASQAEAHRYGQLKRLYKAGYIEDLNIQPEYRLVLKNKPMFVYRADFSYIVTQTNEEIVEDVKGMKTPVYRLKKKIIETEHDINIVEIPATRRELDKWSGATPYKDRPNRRDWLKREWMERKVEQ